MRYLWSKLKVNAPSVIIIYLLWLMPLLWGFLCEWWLQDPSYLLSSNDVLGSGLTDVPSALVVSVLGRVDTPSILLVYLVSDFNPFRFKP